MFNKIYNFLVDYEDLIKFIGILFTFLLSCLLVTSWFDKQNVRDIDIIEKTKEYKIFNSCKKIEDKYYCWEE